tara:strand:+ start:207 stop:473 length:267 start_codon:yes stop_codon:yes gene_type:complete
MSRLLIKGPETALNAGGGNKTNCGSATVVRIFNSSNATVLVTVQDVDANAIGSFSMPTGTTEILEKNPSDEIFGTGGNVKFTKLGYTN